MDLLSVYDSDSDDNYSASNEQGSIRMLTSSSEAAADAPPLPFVRSQPHVDGNWAGSCFCRLPLDEKRVDTAIEQVVAMAESRGYNGACLRHSEYHISLSRTFFLQDSNISPFVEVFTQRLLRCQPGNNYASSFPVTIDMDQPALLQNDEATRSFLVWPVYASGPTLRALVEQCDAVLARYDQPRFYDPPLFHVSIASFVPVLRMGQLPIGSSGHDDDDDAKCMIHHVYCKFGTTRLFPIPLHQA